MAATRTAVVTLTGDALSLSEAAIAATDVLTEPDLDDERATATALVEMAPTLTALGTLEAMVEETPVSTPLSISSSGTSSPDTQRSDDATVAMSTSPSPTAQLVGVGAIVAALGLAGAGGGWLYRRRRK